MEECEKEIKDLLIHKLDSQYLNYYKSITFLISKRYVVEICLLFYSSNKMTQILNKKEIEKNMVGIAGKLELSLP